MKKTIQTIMAFLLFFSITACSTSDAPKKEEKKAEDKKEEKQEKKQTASTAEKKNNKDSNTLSGGNTTPQQPATPPTDNSQKPVTPPAQPPVCPPNYKDIGNSGKVFATFEEAWNWGDYQMFEYESSPWYCYGRYLVTEWSDECGNDYFTVDFYKD